MTIILIGSQAAKVHSLNFKRETHDNEYDMIGTLAEMEAFLEHIVDYGGTVEKKSESTMFPGKWKIKLDYPIWKEQQPPYGTTILIEFDATENLSNKILRKVVHDEYRFFDTDVLVPSQEYLYAIKRSHANFNNHFEKTFEDLALMQNKGWDAIDRFDMELMRFVGARYEEAKARDGNRQDRIKLNKSNDDFFMGGANLRTYEHDDLHRAVAFYPQKPMFERCKRDMNSAKIERDMFNALSYVDRLWMATEEASVLALERFYIPEIQKGRKVTQTMAMNMYRAGVKKVAKDLCKGWFQDFMIDNAWALLNTGGDWNYTERFEKALAAGLVHETKKS